MNNKLENISLIKVIMIIVIILYHSMAFFGNQWFTLVSPVVQANYLNEISKWIDTFQNQTLVMVSGYLFYYLKTEMNKYTNPQIDIKKRAKRLLVPYVFTCLFWVIPIEYLLYKHNAITIIDKYVLANSPSQLWFLVMLFIVFVIFDLLSKKIKITKSNFFIIYMLSTIIGFLLLKNIVFYNFQIAKVIAYCLYFYLGGYIYYNRKKITKKQIIISIILSITLYITCMFLNSKEIELLNCISYFLNNIISVCEVLVIYCLCTWLIKNNKITTKNKIYKLIEENRFGIYLFHQQIIYFTIILLNGIVHPVIQVLLTFIISIITSLIISLVLKKNQITKNMFSL